MKPRSLWLWILIVAGLVPGCGKPTEDKASFEKQSAALEQLEDVKPVFALPDYAGPGGGRGIGGGKGGDGGMGTGGGGGRGGGRGTGGGGGMGGGRGRGDSSGGGNEFSPRLAALDANDDGQLERQEFTGGDEEFARLDADGDTIVTPREAHNAPSLFLDLLKLFDQIDTDGDGNIVLKEWYAVFNQLDADDDRSLTREELRQAPENPFAKLVLEHFSHFDRFPQPIHDNAISIEEWELDFGDMDRAVSRDGKVTREEVKARLGARARRLMELRQSGELDQDE